VEALDGDSFKQQLKGSLRVEKALCAWINASIDCYSFLLTSNTVDSKYFWNN
jgi:hypothetical protein